VTALVAERFDLVADGAQALGIATPKKSSRYVAPSAPGAASECQAVLDSVGLPRRTAPGGEPTTSLNARAKAAWER
jgi:hypothetical protein